MSPQNLDKQFKELVSQIYLYNPSFDQRKVKHAWDFAAASHEGQKRKSGEDFINHPIAVARMLAEWRLDTTSVISALLHDTVEDTSVTLEEIEKEFGSEVSFIVDGVTKVSNLKLKTENEEMVENLRKMFFVMAKDLRVIMVKLADRLHNMRTIYVTPKEKQIANSVECLEIYAPIAERLGISKVKFELENIAFPIVYPEEYKRVRSISKPLYEKSENLIDEMISEVQRGLKNHGIAADVHGRRKHLFSLWRKLERETINWDFSKVHDLFAIRIVVDDVATCYETLGIVHNLYKPYIPVGVSDYIAQPKANGYQSIHTKVFGGQGKIVEVQIRTKEMHEFAESGIAAHWLYSETKSKPTSEDRIRTGVAVANNKRWIEQLVLWQKEIVDSQEFLKAIKFDALRGRILVFTPKGDVIDLPEGATPIDFAFAVHTELGLSMTGAKVNGKMAPLAFKLKNGDVIEVMRSKKTDRPTQSWLGMSVTVNARKSINKYLRSRS